MTACVKCGGPLPVQTGRGRRRIRCESCAPSRNKGRTAARVELPAEVVSAGLVAAVRAELDAAGVAGGSAGQAALLLASRIEFGENSGSAVAQLVRQLHDSLARALAAEQPSELDPVAAFRAQLDRI